MAKLPKGYSKCAHCGVKYISNDGKGIKREYCHMKCRFEAEKLERSKACEINRIKKEFEYSKNPVTCPACLELFIKNQWNDKYCSKFCVDKTKQLARLAKSMENKIPKKPNCKLGGWLEYARVKKKKGPSLKQFNACRG